MNNIIEGIRNELEKSIDEKTKDSAQRFFKEEVKFYGVKTSVVMDLARQFFPQAKILGKSETFSLCETLLVSGYNEEAWIAANWAYWFCEEYSEEDFEVFDKWVHQYIENWASCDTLCNHAVGAFIEKYPEFIGKLIEWTKSPNRWVKRAAAVTLILPARKGKFLTEVFEIADNLLTDRDDMVQKGYGWMLKEASKLHQQEVFEYVMRHRKDMPRTALRYAIEKMPPDLRKNAMERV